MTWLLIGILVWIVVALLVALVLGTSIRTAEKTHEADEARALAELEAAERNPGTVTVDVPAPENADLPYTGPETRPYPPPPSVPRQRRHLLPFHPARDTSDDPSQKDSGAH
jgi:hypothetical protein